MESPKNTLLGEGLESDSPQKMKDWLFATERQLSFVSKTAVKVTEDSWDRILMIQQRLHHQVSF